MFLQLCYGNLLIWSIFVCFMINCTIRVIEKHYKKLGYMKATVYDRIHIYFQLCTTKLRRYSTSRTTVTLPDKPAHLYPSINLISFSTFRLTNS